MPFMLEERYCVFYLVLNCTELIFVNVIKIINDIRNYL